MYEKIYHFLSEVQAEMIHHPKRKKGFLFEDGWVYSTKFGHFQKVRKGLYVYISPQMFGGWIVQGYPRAERGICSLEARIRDAREIDKLFNLGQKWLDKYQEGLEDIELDPYYPFCEKGWKGSNITEEPLLY